MFTRVLLKVARMFAMPTMMFLEPLALMIFLAFASSPSSSAAVGADPAAGASGGVAGAPAPGFPSAPASPTAFLPFGALPSALASVVFASPAGAAAPSGAASFFGAAFLGFVSSAILRD